ncbi:MAG: PhnD/SsuA/transferrin family substrate-binding protein [Clostridiales Family XIII bacterium]|jgi:phosphonate transport system substrate-binding protein|nr:PhnD/SsuA/transferrin family substrate-binding protein [Clostridiales Family XIII bacterium]
MRKHRISRVVPSILLAVVMAAAMIGCGSGASNNASASNDAAEADAQDAGAQTSSANTGPINVVWYPNESSNTHEDIRAEVGRLIEQATGRKAEHKLTTDYTIAIESIASGSADIAMSMGAVGYVEAKNRNPQVDVLFVNADANGTLEEAKYFSWLCVNTSDADQYKSGGTYAIDNIKGKKMSFVSNSSTSGFRVPTASIIEHFASDNLDEDQLIEGGSDKFFGEVYFGGSHQGSAVNLVGGIADVAAFCDIELAPYIELKEGAENTVGAVYAVKQGADAPFDVHAGKDFVVIACTPVFNGPCAYNPQNLSADEIEALRALFTSPEVADNETLFYDADVEGASGLFKKSSSYGYVLTADSWYDPYRR